MRNKHNAFGFTLVELMIVVAIIAILVAIAVPIYLNTVANAELVTCQANVKIINGAVAQYFMTHGVYPTNLDALISPTNLLSMPHCPTAGTSVEYSYDPTTRTTTCTIEEHNR